MPFVLAVGTVFIFRPSIGHATLTEIDLLIEEMLFTAVAVILYLPQLVLKLKVKYEVVFRGDFRNN